MASEETTARGVTNCNGVDRKVSLLAEQHSTSSKVNKDTHAAQRADFVMST